jgi:hypothetical protein
MAPHACLARFGSDVGRRHTPEVITAADYGASSVDLVLINDAHLHRTEAADSGWEM